MEKVSVSSLRTGEVLAENVFTPLGGLLFSKGERINQREIDILKAFFIPQVYIETEKKMNRPSIVQIAEGKNENRERLMKQPSKESEVKDRTNRYEEAYKNSVALGKKIMDIVFGGHSIPILEIRQTIIPMIKEAQNQPNILSILSKIEHVDSYRYHHMVSVSIISSLIARWINLPEKDWVQIGLAGFLHDIGFAKLTPQILYKKGPLTQEEYEEVKRHPVYGYQILKDVPGLNEGAKLAALQHHEREDGTGYPLGIESNQIHVYSKIIAVADIFHAMCSERHYKKPNSPYVVLEHLLNDSFGKLDPQVVHSFVQQMTQFSTGTVVRLNNGESGKIIFVDKNNPTRPYLEVNGKIINLIREKSLNIQEIITVDLPQITS
ncbi:HD-GYP domain-containing protein [Microaerobacter geothermalis]|uniref:HD-GYP domain-containing protein n=1 Tax=Microaerobacter geothermalis TaxID=674972 RepID=UPI001F18D1F0|nr:HD domain-containing phosphohydrolase [Microaerobacter geothermalis]MCF6095087.1 HD-GYP domain-containing protein [Microaerobacter geothermalis]